ncbi:MAG: hypothetical protein U9N02_04725 [Campylobacterota bacterium]|nr:hypothetical protein [Campylobacterota bacterium]
MQISNQLKNFIYKEMLDVPMYIVEIENHKVIYANEAMENMIASVDEEKCWKAINNRESLCSWCPLKNKNISDIFEREYFHEFNEKWYKIRTKYTKLDDGKDVLISLMTDITSQKEAQGELITTQVELTQQAEKLLELNVELDKHKNNLKIKVEEEIQKRKDNEKILFQQSRLASMGEMIDAIAHQWKQPLNVISALNTNLKFSSELGKDLTEEYIEKHHKNINIQISRMTNTLNEFRSFFRPSKNQENFYIKDMINNVLSLVKDDLLKNSIDDNIIDDIFKANMTTKDEDKGTGIGLYMSSQIAQKHNGTISAKNVDNGVKFIFKTKIL